MFSATIDGYGGMKRYNNMDEFTKTLDVFIKEAKPGDMIKFVIHIPANHKLIEPKLGTRAMSVKTTNFDKIYNIMKDWCWHNSTTLSEKSGLSVRSVNKCLVKLKALNKVIVNKEPRPIQYKLKK